MVTFFTSLNNGHGLSKQINIIVVILTPSRLVHCLISPYQCDRERESKRVSEIKDREREKERDRERNRESERERERKKEGAIKRE